MLTPAHLESFRRYGVAFPIPVLSPAMVSRFRAACDELELRLGGNPRTVEVRQMHLCLRWACELALNEGVLDAVEAVLGPNLIVWATELFAKREANPTLQIGWHRDRPYMGFDPAHSVTAWVSLGPSEPSNGCLQVVLEPDRRARADASLASAEGPPPPDRVTNVVLAPGEMSLHDIDVLHGSGPNLSLQKRVGFAIRFVTADARTPAGRPPVLVARGRASDEHFDLRSPPTHDDFQAARLELEAAARAHWDAMLFNVKTLRRKPSATPNAPTHGERTDGHSTNDS